MDDDIFFSDQEMDQRTQDKILAENEKRKIDKELWNKGYLNGLEWAESNYEQLELDAQN